MNHASHRLAVLALAAAVACSDDDDTPAAPLDGGVDAAVDATIGLDAQPVPQDASTCPDGGILTSIGCRARSVCPPGTYVSAVGTGNLEHLCTACPEGTYSQVNNASACVALGQPAAGSVD